MTHMRYSRFSQTWGRVRLGDANVVEGTQVSRSYGKYLASLLLFGSNGIVASGIALPSTQIVLLRTLLGAALLVVVLLASRQRLVGREHPREVAALAVSGSALGVSWVFLFQAYRLVGVGTSTLLYYLGPVIVMALAPILLHERLGAPKLACFAAVLVGAYLVVSQGSDGLGSTQGILCGLGAAVFYAVMVIAGKGSHDVGGLEAATIQLVASFVVVALYMPFAGALSPIAASSVPLIVMLGLVNTGLGCYLYFSAMGRLSVQSVSVLGYLEPVSAVLLSAVLLAEPLGPGRILGAVLVLGGAMACELVGRRHEGAGRRSHGSVVAADARADRMAA